ncbi:hypothetical protein EUX98_g1289 [Antrodiella citrinella]|uniref:Uncharacterized protein n=1 Tax=Antrodiella citrinella TaxID=2447956 RepID=A0A4S4N4U7_9APHY|nr:hypothetical protein EUX98_g1289 [Antrodiella citrinella]
MAIAGKTYKKYNTRTSLAQLDDLKLSSAGVTDKEERKLVLAALKKAGYKKTAPAVDPGAPSTITSSSRTRGKVKTGANHSGTSLQSQPGEAQKGAKKKRKRDDTLNDYLPDHAPDDGESYGTLSFNEILDEKYLMSKSTMINRAPVMTAWSFIVAERLGFQREEALSIGQWRALSTGTPVSPSAAFSYITRTLQQTAPQIVGALRLLGASYAPAELNTKGYALYVEFRPEVDGWGKKNEVKCSKILGLRKKVEGPTMEGPTMDGDGDVVDTDKIVQMQTADEEFDKMANEAEEPEPKKARGMTLEEYEAALDADDAFNDLDFGIGDLPGDSMGIES